LKVITLARSVTVEHYIESHYSC